MEDTLSTLTDRLNVALASSGYPFKLALVDVDKLRRPGKNARFMTGEQFRNLVENIKQDHGLSSVPFCWLKEGEFHIVSGKHRVDAAQQAGQQQVLVLYTDAPMSRQEFVARQLSHNSISGQDDAAVLKSLWAEIEDVGLKYYAGLDDKTLGELAAAASSKLNPIRMDWKSVSFMFLPADLKLLEETLPLALSYTAGADVRLAAEFRQFEEMLGSLEAARKAKNVRCAALALMTILREWNEQHKQQQAQAENGQTTDIRPDHASGDRSRPRKRRAHRKANRPVPET